MKCDQPYPNYYNPLPHDKECPPGCHKERDEHLYHKCRHSRDQTIISVKNKLEVKPGNILQIPGQEPTTSITSIELATALRCKAAVIDVHKALKLIPGSRLVRMGQPLGHLATGWYFELPSGPPRDGNKCPACCLSDWYRILCKHARIMEVEGPSEECAGQNFSGCINDIDPFSIVRNPDTRPNSKPLQNPFSGKIYH